MKHAVFALAIASLLSSSITTNATAKEIALTDGFRAVQDGAGEVRLEIGDDVPADLTLLWYDATASRARDLGADPDVPGGRLVTRLRHWGWFHVDPIAFVDARLLADDGAELNGAVGMRFGSAEAWRRREVTVRPHLAVGRAPEVTVEVFETVVDLDVYDRRHVGVVRLDGRRAVSDADGRSFLWEAGTARSWPLALIVARSRDSLDFLVGQALATYDDVGRARSPIWKTPPMCGHCRTPRIEELRLEVTLLDRVMRVEADVRSSVSIHPIAWPALRLEDVPMNLFYHGRDDDRVVYEIPLESPVALELAKAFDRGDVDAKIFMHAGPGHEPEGVFVMSPPGLAERVETYAPIDVTEDLPSYLSPRLVQNWPNPFRNETSIEVTVPATMAEAFDVDAGLLARIDPLAAPPFGPAPTVRVKVYNVSGKLVDVLDESVREPGRFIVHWDGNDMQGRPVAAGAYYVNVEIGEWSVTRRVLRIRTN